MGEQPRNIRQDFLANRDVIMGQGQDVVSDMESGIYKKANRQMAGAISSLPPVDPEIGKQVINQVLPAERAPVEYGAEASFYRPSTGNIYISEKDRQTLPVNAYVHEQSHAQQTPRDVYQQDIPLRGELFPFVTRDRAAREIAPVLAGNIADYEARRRSGAAPLPGGIALAPEYEPSLEWMRQMAEKHGMFKGTQMETLLAQNPQFVKMLAQLYEGTKSKPRFTYETGSLRPIPVSAQ